MVDRYRPFGAAMTRDDSGIWVQASDYDTLLAMLVSYPTDRDGWICSVCHGWNVPKDRVCMHSHLPAEPLLCDGCGKTIAEHSILGECPGPVIGARFQSRTFAEPK